MSYDHTAPKRPVNLNVNSDLVERCKASVGNFSAHVESLLAADLERRELSEAAESAARERAIDLLSELYRTEGSLSEETQEL